MERKGGAADRSHCGEGAGRVPARLLQLQPPACTIRHCHYAPASAHPIMRKVRGNSAETWAGNSEPWPRTSQARRGHLLLYPSYPTSASTRHTRSAHIGMCAYPRHTLLYQPTTVNTHTDSQTHGHAQTHTRWTDRPHAVHLPRCTQPLRNAHTATPSLTDPDIHRQVETCTCTLRPRLTDTVTGKHTLPSVQEDM